MGKGGNNSSDVKRRYAALREPLMSGIIQAASGSGVSAEEYARRMDAAFADDAFDPSKAATALKAYTKQLAKINKVKLNAIHPSQRSTVQEMLFNTLPPYMVEQLKAGEVPTKETNSADATASGMTNVR